MPLRIRSRKRLKEKRKKRERKDEHVCQPGKQQKQSIMHIKECTVKGEKKNHWVKGNLAKNKQTNKKKKEDITHSNKTNYKRIADKG